MSSIYEYASNDIFRTLDSIVDRFAIDLPTISMSFVEIAGDLCHDLLNRFEPVQLLTGNDGSVHAYPVVEPVVASASQLLGHSYIYIYTYNFIYAYLYIYINVYVLIHNKPIYLYLHYKYAYMYISLNITRDDPSRYECSYHCCHWSP